MMKENCPSPPRKSRATSFRVLDNSYLLEEETYSWYDPAASYPVRIGEIFQSRYQVLGKLGYGSVSTAWLCRDLIAHEYVALKVFVSKHRQADNEEQVYTHLKSIKSNHPGVRGIRALRDQFQLPGNYGPHECLVHEPLGLTLKDIREMSEDEKVDAQLLKPIIKYLLMSLDFLHTEARVVHTDVQEGNIMLGIEDDAIFKTFEEEESVEPSLRKFDGDRIIYATRQVDIPENPSRAVLCDFGDAHFGDETYIGEVMPDLYRAPEIVLGIPWDEKIDIWSVGLMVWGLFEGKHLFMEPFPSREASRSAHIARMIALLGPPPKKLLQRGQFSNVFFDGEGNFKPDIEIPKSSLDNEEENLEGEEKKLFLEFLKKMIQWVPEDRRSAKELVEDPWLAFASW
ncbi:putative CDK4/6 [Stipitochalara longipes BDJ]|nr:putative CDK4/6 [Stipitochalara longipes BDJ]